MDNKVWVILGSVGDFDYALGVCSSFDKALAVKEYYEIMDHYDLVVIKEDTIDKEYDECKKGFIDKIPKVENLKKLFDVKGS